MPKKNVLTVEDDRDILELIEYNLSREGFNVFTAISGEEGLQIAQNKLPDIILLDLMLPDIGGLEICKSLKSKSPTSNIPIIMLTAKGEEADIVTGLEIGADDYITKPFSLKVLVARIKAVLRRKDEAPPEKSFIRRGDLVIDPGKHEVLLKEKPVELTLTEFRILQFLASRPGWVFTRYQIVDAVKGDDYPVTDRSVDVQIAGLRKKLGTHGSLVQTVRGVGYRFKEL